MNRLFYLIIVFLLPAVTVQAQRLSFNATPSWQDEFNGSSINDNIWNVNKRLGGSKRVFYTGNNKNNLYEKDGKLNIIIRKEDIGNAQTTSAYLSSKREFKTGKFEFRVRCANTKGLWPTIWLREYNQYTCFGEMDLLEYIACFGNNAFQTNFHIWGIVNGKKNCDLQNAKRIPIDIRKWHIYTFEWYPNELVMKVDGKEYYSLKKDQVAAWPFNNEGYHFDITVGTGGWAESCGSNYKKLPQRMQMDWIRYYELNK